MLPSLLRPQQLTAWPTHTTDNHTMPVRGGGWDVSKSWEVEEGRCSLKGQRGLVFLDDTWPAARSDGPTSHMSRDPRTFPLGTRSFCHQEPEAMTPSFESELVLTCFPPKTMAEAMVPEFWAWASRDTAFQHAL